MICMIDHNIIVCILQIQLNYLQKYQVLSLKGRNIFQLKTQIFNFIKVPNIF